MAHCCYLYMPTTTTSAADGLIKTAITRQRLHCLRLQDVYKRQLPPSSWCSVWYDERRLPLCPLSFAGPVDRYVS